jgi:hypothetical protein
MSIDAAGADPFTHFDLSSMKSGFPAPAGEIESKMAEMEAAYEEAKAALSRATQVQSCVKTALSTIWKKRRQRKR